MRSSTALARSTTRRREADLAPRPLHLLVALAGVWVWMSPAGAQAYCRTTTCDPQAEDCDPPAGSDCTTQGLPVYWPGQCVGYSLQRDASPKIPYDTFQGVAELAFSAWTQVDCGEGKAPSIDLADLGSITCAQPEYNQHSGNANVIMFRNTTWPYSNATHTLALTTVTFNTQTAEIYDVDMEVNASNVDLTTTDAGVHYDLQSIITHEAGHFLGLAHSSDPSATMYAKYQQGSTSLRSLAPDDEAGICAVYPPDRTAAACNTTPRHGYQDTCGDAPPPTDSGCSLHGPGTGRDRGAGMAAILASLVALAASRRRRTGA